MLLSTQTKTMCARLGAEEGVRRLCMAGYDALDISLFHLKDAACPENGPDYRAHAQKLKQVARAYGVTFRQGHAPFGGAKEQFMAECVPHFPRTFAYAAELGVKIMVVHPIHHGPYFGHEEEFLTENLAFYRSLLPLAKEYDMKVAVENMWQRHPVTGRITEDVCSNPKELREYVERLDDPHFTACLDLGHVGLCGREAQDAIRTLGPVLGALHVHDNDYIHDSHTLPFCGKMNWSAICEALKEVGYAGDFTYEADEFLTGFSDEMLDGAARFMHDVGRNLVARIAN